LKLKWKNNELNRKTNSHTKTLFQFVAILPTHRLRIWTKSSEKYFQWQLQEFFFIEKGIQKIGQILFQGTSHGP
jgi:hypothetical protein